MATNNKNRRPSPLKSSKASGNSAPKRSNTASDSGPGTKARSPGGGGKQKQRPKGKAQSRQARQQPRRQQSSSGGGGNQSQGRIRHAATAAVGSVKGHPLTAAAIGVGVAALAYTGVKALASGGQTGERGKSRSATGARDGAEREDEDADVSNDAASTDEDDEGSQAGGRLRQSLREVQSIWEDHPLILAAAPALLGGMIGLLLPKTQVEDKTFGEFSDRLAGRAKRAGRRLLEQGRRGIARTISEAASATAEGAERVGLSPDDVGRKIRRIAGHVRDAITKAVADTITKAVAD